MELKPEPLQIIFKMTEDAEKTDTVIVKISSSEKGIYAASSEKPNFTLDATEVFLNGINITVPIFKPLAFSFNMQKNKPAGDSPLGIYRFRNKNHRIRQMPKTAPDAAYNATKRLEKNVVVLRQNHYHLF